MSKHRETPTIIRRRLIAVGAGAALLIGVVGVSVGSAIGGASESPAETAATQTSLSPAEPDADPGGAETSGETSAAASTDRAALSPAVAAQLAYVEANWQATSNEEFGFLAASDCVNFASQSLLERGWQTDDEWWYEPGGDPYSHASPWISSTAFRDYLADHPERATALTDDQRDQVKVGDIVQFDWDNSGDRDHTGIVTGVMTLADGTVSIEYAGHTDPTYDFTVDEAITVKHPGGTAYYWSIPE